MMRQIPGLRLNHRGVEYKLEGLFLVRLDREFLPTADGNYATR